jgi:CubicO group peptidase (beta-lactamase class C family)
MTTRCLRRAIIAAALLAGPALIGRPTTPAAAAEKPDVAGQRDLSAEAAWLRHGLSEAQRDQIRAAFQWGIDRKFVPGGALLLMHRGETVFREGFGVADIASGKPFTPDLPCRIASLTKPHTSTLMAMLVEQGKLSWDDPIDKYLPRFARMQVRGHGPASRPPKIRELLSHTAGFPGQNAINSGQWHIDVTGTLADAVDDLAGQGLATEPGQVFAYTGMGYMVAGRIAEVVTGKEFSALMKEMLLDPIGATTATFHPSEELKQRMPTPYGRKDGAFAKIDPSARPRAMATYPNPAGGLISTLDDVGRFLLLHRNRGVANGKRLVSADTLAALYRAQPATGPNSYGLGFNVLNVGAGGVGVRVHHIGASGTLAELDFDDDLLIVFLTQVPQTETLPFRRRLVQAIYAVFESPSQRDNSPRPAAGEGKG